MEKESLLAVLGQKVLKTSYRRMVVVTKHVTPNVAIHKAGIDAVI